MDVIQAFHDSVHVRLYPLSPVLNVANLLHGRENCALGCVGVRTEEEQARKVAVQRARRRGSGSACRWALHAGFVADQPTLRAWLKPSIIVIHWFESLVYFTRLPCRSFTSPSSCF